MRFLLPATKSAKIVVAILIIVVASATGVIGYYTATHPPWPNASSSPAPSSVPLVSSAKPFTPPAAITPTPPPTTTPTPSSTSTPTLSPSPTPTLKPTPSPTLTQTPPPTPAPTPTPTSTITSKPSPSEQTPQEKIRDSVMSFIRSNHHETAQFMIDLVWTGGRFIPPNLVGAETYTYYSQGWNVTLTYPVVLNPVYKIVADFSATGVSIPYRIIWNGIWQNEVINETSYIFAQ